MKSLPTSKRSDWIRMDIPFFSSWLAFFNPQINFKIRWLGFGNAGFERWKGFPQGSPSPKTCPRLNLSHRIHGAGIFPYIYHKNQLNVGKYTIHGWYGYRVIQEPNKTVEEIVTLLGRITYFYRKALLSRRFSLFPRWDMLVSSLEGTNLPDPRLGSKTICPSVAAVFFWYHWGTWITPWKSPLDLAFAPSQTKHTHFCDGKDVLKNWKNPKFVLMIFF